MFSAHNLPVTVVVPQFAVQIVSTEKGQLIASAKQPAV